MEISFVEEVLQILKTTNDGDDLDPGHLYLLQEAVNRNLTPTGVEAFVALHYQVMTGYKKPWLHGVEHLTIDHEGYVYWKGQRVEHYTMSMLSGMRSQAQELGRWCRILEANGIGISVGSAVWYWEIIERVLYNEVEVNEHSDFITSCPGRWDR